MLSTKKKIIALAALAVLLGGVGSAFAYGHGYGMNGYCGGFGPGAMGGYMGGAGPGNQAWSQEQRQEFDTMADAFFSALEPKRQDLYAKQLELDALSRNANADPGDISRLAREIAALSGELRQAGQEFREELGEKFGSSLPPFGPGMGRGGYGGMRGHGGYGGMRGYAW